MERKIFDSGINYPISYPLNVSSDTVNTFHIPSSRYFYYTLDGRNTVPYLAKNNDPEQTRKDVAAWSSNNYVYPTVYSLHTDDSIDPAIDFVAITEGKRVHLPDDLNARDRRIRSFVLFLSDLEDAFNFPSDRNMIEQMYSHPFNKAADFNQANGLAYTNDVRLIQKYLNERGIVTFKAEDIFNLQPIDKFFYLTRFYGPPQLGNLDTLSTSRKYIKLSSNEVTRRLATQVSVNFNLYQQFQNEFDQFFKTLNINPNYPIEQHFGTTSAERIYANFFDYLKLLKRPQNLPVLTLNTIRQLNTTNRDQIVKFLSNYLDNQIIGLVGDIDRLTNSRTRNALLKSAAQHLITNRTFILFPNEAELCNNKISVGGDKFSELGYVFIGKGSISTGFTCYDILTDLFENFDANTEDDGTITFIDPSSREPRNFTADDLKGFRDAVASGRGGITSDKKLLDKFNSYIRQAEIQESSAYAGIKAFRKFIMEDPQNKNLIRDILMIFFRIGMYMRQWKGPGNPYPIESSETGETVEGTGEAQDFVKQNVERETGTFWNNFIKFPKNFQEIFWNLPAYAKRGNIIEDIGYNIRKLWNDVIQKGGYCVRLASNIWTFSGAYYLKQILNEEIVGFDLGRGVAHIQ
jgi:hypothetical protein